MHIKCILVVAVEEGFEPSQTDPESVVLPLHNSTNSLRTIPQNNKHFNIFFKFHINKRKQIMLPVNCFTISVY